MVKRRLPSHLKTDRTPFSLEVNSKFREYTARNCILSAGDLSPGARHERIRSSYSLNHKS